MESKYYQVGGIDHNRFMIALITKLFSEMDKYKAAERSSIFDEVCDFSFKHNLFYIDFDYGVYTITYLGNKFDVGDYIYPYIFLHWKHDINRYIMSKFDGKYFKIPSNKYTVTK